MYMEKHVPTEADIKWIEFIGQSRRDQARLLGCKDRYDFSPASEEAAVALDILGAAGEWAFCQELSSLGEPEEWQATLGSFSGADHIARDGAQWQVKTTRRGMGLIIRPNYDPSHLYALVTTVSDDWRAGMIVRGWERATAIKYGVVRSTSDGRGDFRVIPGNQLKVTDDYPEWRDDRAEKMARKKISLTQVGQGVS